jgi:hypothetical protein
LRRPVAVRYFSYNPTIRGGSAGTAEPDNGFDGDENGAGRGQLLVGDRVPDGTGSPADFTSSNGQLVFVRRADEGLPAGGGLPLGG